jgi:hypothetical protein
VSTVKKPFGFAVVPWTVHQFSLVLVRVVPGQGQRFCIELTPSTGQRFSAGRVCWAWVRGSQPPAPEAGRPSCRCELFAQASARVRGGQRGRSRSVTSPESSKRARSRLIERCN